MSVFGDFHVHSGFSADSDSSMENMIASALSRGLTYLCFTEHLDMDSPPQYDPFDLDIPAYYEAFCLLREKYTDQITLLFGIELGMQPHLTDACRSVTLRWPFDYVVASQHLLYREDPWYEAFWNHRDSRNVCRDYLTALYDNLKRMTDYDTCAHLDYIVRYIPKDAEPYRWSEYADILEPLLSHLIRSEKCLEINTSQLCKGFSMPNPDAGILSLYHELGGRLITFGSDAHSPDKIGAYFDRAAALARQVGFSEYVFYRNRQPETLRL